MKWMLITWSLINPEFNGHVAVLEYDNILFPTHAQCDRAKDIMIEYDKGIRDGTWLCVETNEEIQNQTRGVGSSE